jgi:toxin ParE1/3/4
MQPVILVISPAAQSDLEAIYVQGVANWGESQSVKYLNRIKEHVKTLLTQPLMGMERPELMVGLRSFPVEQHVVFYRLAGPENSHLEVVRVLHGRQDPELHV